MDMIPSSPRVDSALIRRKNSKRSNLTNSTSATATAMAINASTPIASTPTPTTVATPDSTGSERTLTTRRSSYTIQIPSTSTPPINNTKAKTNSNSKPNSSKSKSKHTKLKPKSSTASNHDDESGHADGDNNDGDGGDESNLNTTIEIIPQSPSTSDPVTPSKTPSSANANGGGVSKQRVDKTARAKRNSPKTRRKTTELEPASSDKSNGTYQGHANFGNSLRQPWVSSASSRAKPKQIVNEIIPSKPAPRSQVIAQTYSIKGHEDEVTTIDLLDQTQMLLSGSKDKTVRVWDLSRGCIVATLRDHEYIVKRVLASGPSFYSASRNSLRVWDSRTYDCSKTLKMKGDINDMVLSQDQKYVYIATEKTLRTYDMRTFQQLDSYNAKAKIGCLHEIPSTNSVAFSAMNNITVYCPFRPEDAKPKNLSPPHYDKVLCMTTSGRHLFSGSRDYSIKRWDENDANGYWSEGASIPSAHGNYVTALRVLTGEKHLISGSMKGCLKVWDVKTCKLVTEVDGHSASINDILIKGNSIFTASSDNTINVWRSNLPKDKEEVALRRQTYNLGDVNTSTLSDDSTLGEDVLAAYAENLRNINVSPQQSLNSTVTLKKKSKRHGAPVADDDEYREEMI